MKTAVFECLIAMPVVQLLVVHDDPRAEIAQASS